MEKKLIPVLILIAAVLLAYFFLTGSEDISYTESTSETVISVADNTETETSEDAENITETDLSETEAPAETELTEAEEIGYTFRNDDLYESHYRKHGAEFGNITKEEYLQKANELINSDSPDVLHKTEKEDGDYLFYNPKTNEFLVLSTDGYIRTYFKPDDGIEYWERQ